MATQTRTKPRTRNSQRRATPGTSGRNTALGVVAGLGAVAVAGIAAAARFGLFDRLIAAASRTGAEHAAPDLALDKPQPGPADRAPEAFRPDPTAPVTAAERESLRPAPTVGTGFTRERQTETVR